MSVQTSQPVYPEIGDLVVATVTRVVDYGFYVKLDEFNGTEGLVHIQEISTTWVRNIRDHAREGQKVVLKVLRVSPTRNQIDLSLRRVTGREKSEKMLEWKKERKAESILRSAADKLKRPPADVESLKTLLMDKFGSLYEPLENGLDEGSEELLKAGVAQDWIDAIAEASKSKIRLERSRVRTTVSATCYKPGGLEILKKSFAAAKKVRKPRGAEVRIYSLGAPRYRVEVMAGSFEAAEKALNSVVEELVSSIKSSGGEARKIG